MLQPVFIGSCLNAGPDICRLSPAPVKHFSRMSAIKLHDKGKYNLAPDSLPHGEHQPGAVPFRGTKDTRTLSALIIMVVLAVPTVIRCGGVFGPLPLLLGCAVPILLLFPHELLL